MERRNLVRANSALPMRYKKLRGGSVLPRSTVTRNLSEGGLLFDIEAFVPFACHFSLEINLPGISKPVQVVSKIAWIKKLPTGDDYEVGNQFLEIARADKEIIRNFVKEQARIATL